MAPAASDIGSDGALSIEDLRGNPRRMLTERVVRVALFTAGLTSVVISALIVGSLVKEAWAFITSVDLGSLWAFGWYPRRGVFDVRTLFVGSLLVAGIAMVVAGPVGLGTAIYLAEYARPGVRRVLKPIIEILAGIPSVVLGYFAFAVVSPDLVQRVRPDAPQANLLAAGIGVGILTIPLVASVAEDALRSVPSSLREASYGLGARKVTTSIKVVVPAAVSGLVAALILAVSRAIGETMVVFIAAGGTGGATFNVDPTEKGSTMTAAMAAVASGTDQVKGAANTYQSLFFVGLLLFLITLGLNIVAGRFVRRVRQRY